MNMKMVLIPVERFRTLEKMANNCSINKESHIETATSLSTKIPSPKSNMTNTIPPDVELKMLRQKKMRKSYPSQTVVKRPVILSPDAFPTNKKKNAKALIKHLEKNRDRINYDTGELFFDGIKSGDSDIKDLTSAVVLDSNPTKTPGWRSMINALEATDLSKSVYGRWIKKNKLTDWGAITHT